MTKLGGCSKIGAFLKSSHSKASSVGSARPDPEVKACQGQPVDAWRITAPAIAASRTDETIGHLRSGPAETPNCLSHSPISAKAKNQPAIAQCGWPRPPQSGVTVKRAIGGRLRQSRNKRRASAPFRHALA